MTVDHLPESQPLVSKRPTGVWILTLSDGLFAGVIPIVGIILVFLHEEMRQILGASAGSTLLSVLFGLAVCYAAYRAWTGDDRFRKGLLILITLHWGFIIFNNIQIAVSDVAAQLEPSQRMKLYTNMGRAAIWLAINYWYFLGSRPRAFYASTTHAPPAP